MSRDRARADGREGADARASVAAALREIRREAYKVAAVYAVVDAALVALIANLALRVAEPAWAAGAIRVPLPTGAIEGGVGLPIAVLAAVVAGLVVLAGEFALRARRPVVEQFEAANPAIREMLRTARDAVDDGRDTRMARALYADVLDRLRGTSSVGLVDLRRLSATLVVVVAVSVAGIGVAVVDLDLGDGDRTAPDVAEAPAYDGLRDGEGVLGDAENVSAGDDEIEAEVGGEGEGDAPPGGAPSSYDAGGLPTGDVESQQAGFADAERLEEAELIREYNLRLRNETDE